MRLAEQLIEKVIEAGARWDLATHSYQPRISSKLIDPRVRRRLESLASEFSGQSIKPGLGEILAFKFPSELDAREFAIDAEDVYNAMKGARAIVSVSLEFRAKGNIVSIAQARF